MIKVLLFTCLVAFAYAQPSCQTYCNAFMDICNDDDTVIQFNWNYGDMQECLDVCAAFPLGAVSDVNVNSIGCRTYHAQAANTTGNTSYHCPHASSTGGNYCGTYCQAYCNMSLHECTIANGYTVMGSAALNTYDTCMKICPNYPMGNIGLDTVVNTLACRLYHSQAAIETGDLIHCTHASPNGNDYCGTQCEAYCSAFSGSCGALTPDPYSSEAECLQYCGENMVNLGNWNDTAGDSVSCRVYHADAYLALGAPHCLHAGPSGDNTCGTWCQVYCDIIQNACTGSNQQYASESACMTSCATISTSGNPGDTAGNTIQCRIYHAGVAGLDQATNAQLHCPHAGPTGGGVCVAAATTAAATTGAAVSVVASLSLIVALVAALLL